MNPPVRSAFVDGISFWAPRLPGWELARQVLRGETTAPAEPARRPAPALLPPTERRRAPDTVAVSLEVAARACEAAGLDPATTASVFASTHGDLAISDYMCDTLVSTPTLTSPIRFHNSVHNAAAGYWTIATACYAPYTALSAHTSTFGEGLLESLVQAVTDGWPLLYVAYDIEAKGPMATMAPSAGLLGAGLVISPRASAHSRLRLDWRVVDGASHPPTVASPGTLALVQGNAMAPCLPLFEALATGRGEVSLALGPGLALGVEIVALECRG
ncbi:MAG: hypothetical protein AMJ58_10825 [Gammaproteobacteria bacterium SG8_30]|nr:MAG: hypothetical protein AMJ58_10825 [Gammaproteobacteria bacterium SG8_30]